MIVRDLIEDFWFDCEMIGKTREELRTKLIDEGADPDALVRRVRLIILESKANFVMEKGFDEAMK